jgi:hypothetical protein
MMEVLIDGVKYVPASPRPTEKTLSDALDLRFDSDAGDDMTVRQYLHELLHVLWEKQESFDGKRPFGNSGWHHDLYGPLAKAGFIDLGPLDEDGEPYDWSCEQIKLAHAYVHDLIAAAFFGVGASVKNDIR